MIYTGFLQMGNPQVTMVFNLVLDDLRVPDLGNLSVILCIGNYLIHQQGK